MENQGLLVAQMSGGYLTSPKQKRDADLMPTKNVSPNPPIILLKLFDLHSEETLGGSSLLVS